MSGERPGPPRDGDLLSQALKAVRVHRRMTKFEVAAAMNVPPRTYERFEAGETRINLDYIHRFARATDSDPHAILMAVITGSPAVARRCADNRFATILAIAFRRFDEELGDGLAELEVRALVSAVTTLFDGLVATHKAGDPTRRWLAEGQAELDVKRPRPGR